MRPLCFLLENLILALAASKTDIFLTGCGKLLLNYFYPGTMSRGAPLFFGVVQIRRRKGQQVCVGVEMLKQLHGAAPSGDEVSWRALTLEEKSQTHTLWAFILLGQSL